jgi:hypothetical protein
MMRDTGRMKDGSARFQDCSFSDKGLSVLAIEEQIEKRQLVRMPGQFSGALMFEF